jgi:hypothetical protein
MTADIGADMMFLEADNVLVNLAEELTVATTSLLYTCAIMNLHRRCHSLSESFPAERDLTSPGREVTMAGHLNAKPIFCSN